MSDERLVDPPPFEIGNYHKKALVTLFHHYHDNRQTLTYKELSDALGVGEKTKAWQCEAWKDLKSNQYIVPAEKDRKQLELSAKGLALAAQFLSDEELAEFKVPETDEELHEKIKKKLDKLPKARRYGPKILDFMRSSDYTPMTRHELAAIFDTLADSHGFFYGLKALKTLGYVVECDENEIAQLKANAGSVVKKEHDPSSGEDDTKTEVKNPDTITSGDGEDETTAEGGNDKKRKASAITETEEDNEVGEKKKNKKYKSTRKRSGGKPLKLSDKAHVKKTSKATTAAAAEADEA